MYHFRGVWKSAQRTSPRREEWCPVRLPVEPVNHQDCVRIDPVDDPPGEPRFPSVHPPLAHPAFNLLRRSRVWYPE